VLLAASDVCRALEGGRVTSCKSAKDRTSMSMTLEQSRLLTSYGLALPRVLWAADIMREFGVRRRNSCLNVGKPSFAFNGFQRRLLPRCYRPPFATMDGSVVT
jgi:hypothetical protein